MPVIENLRFAKCDVTQILQNKFTQLTMTSLMCADLPHCQVKNRHLNPVMLQL
jgi:hypothetical protein